MAIVIEEEKRGANMGPVVGVLGILIVLAAAAYYLFFAPAGEVATPAGQSAGAAQGQGIVPVSALTIAPSAVLQNPTFQTLKPSGVTIPTPQGPAPVGRSNPFLAP